MEGIRFPQDSRASCSILRDATCCLSRSSVRVRPRKSVASSDTRTSKARRSELSCCATPATPVVSTQRHQGTIREHTERQEGTSGCGISRRVQGTDSPTPKETYLRLSKQMGLARLPNRQERDAADSGLRHYLANVRTEGARRKACVLFHLWRHSWPLRPDRTRRTGRARRAVVPWQSITPRHPRRAGNT